MRKREWAGYRWSFEREDEFSLLRGFFDHQEKNRGRRLLGNEVHQKDLIEMLMEKLDTFLKNLNFFYPF